MTILTQLGQLVNYDNVVTIDVYEGSIKNNGKKQKAYQLVAFLCTNTEAELGVFIEETEVANVLNQLTNFLSENNQQVFKIPEISYTENQET